MLYPLAVDITDKTILIVGGGNVAYRKVKQLLNYHCTIVIVSPLICDDLKTIITRYLQIQNTIDAPVAKLRWDKQWYQFEALESIQPHLVMTCTDDESINQRIVDHCKRLGILVNSATHGHYPGDCITPTSFDYANKDVQIAIWNNSHLPLISKYIQFLLRNYLEETITEDKLSDAILLLKNLKDHLKQTEPEQEKRQEVLRKIFYAPEFWQWSQDNKIQNQPEKLLAYAQQ